MNVQRIEALEVLQGAFRVDLDDPLKEFKTKYKKWLLRGNHPDTGGTGQDFDRVRQAYHVHANYLTHIQKESPVGSYPANYQEFAADALTKGNHCAAAMANFNALCGIPFEKFDADWKK